EEETLKSFSGALGGLGYPVVIPAMLSEYALAYTDEAALPELTAAAPESPDVFAPRALALAAREWKLNGALCVRKDGLPLYEAAFGFADEQRKQLNTLHTRFAAGDITQSFTAALLLRLEKQKALSLRDGLDKYVPEYVHAKEFRLGELLFTKKLVPDYVENALLGRVEARIREAGLSGAQAEQMRFQEGAARIPDAEFISILNGLALSRDDDDQGARSNFRLLGMAAERAANEPLAELMREKLFLPLGMEDTSLGGAPDAAYMEEIDGRSFALGKPENASGDAGIVTSAADLMKWLEALRSGALLGKAGTEKMFSAKDDGRACGFERDYGWHHVFAGFEGYRTAVYLSRKHGVAFALLANAPSNDLTSPASPDGTGARTLSQRLRRELDTIYLTCESPKLVPVGEQNVLEALQLKPAPGQERYVAPNAVSIAQAYAMRSVARPYVLTQDGTPVGFVMLYADRRNDKYEIWRFMVDARFQGKGFGKAAMERALAQLRLLGAKKAGLSVAPENARAIRVYENAGFRFTGRVSDGEANMEREL
ncbi:MAG TPA: GNAT family N-acetyltransferase, partial [Clostridia bacterium]|nr:GNAT family N-acetyltransferase [Clostridia bacterium]